MTKGARTGVGDFFQSHSDPGIQMFFTLYFFMTGLHALHVIVGMCVLGFLLWKILRGDIGPWASYPLAIGAYPSGDPSPEGLPSS